MAKIISEYLYDNTITLSYDGTQGQYLGTNTYTFNGKTTTSTLAHAFYEPWTIDAGNGNDIINAATIPYTVHQLTLLGGSGRDQIGGSNGGDLINGGADADIIQANGGNDIVIYDPVDILVNGDDGFDIIDASANPSLKGKGVTIDLNSTKDALIGFEGIIGSAFADKLTGDDSNNQITGGAGIDSLAGNGGDDTFFIQTGTDHPLTEGIAGGAGYDKIVFNSTIDGDSLVLNANDAVEEVDTGDPGNYYEGWRAQNIDASQVANTIEIKITGNAGNNILIGNDAANVIDSGVGLDSIYGHGGNDLITLSGFITFSGESSDSKYVDAGAGDDTINGSWSSDRIHGGEGADTIYSDAAPFADDYVYGDGGNDSIFIGGNGDSRFSESFVDGGAGDDIITCEVNNRESINGGEGADSIYSAGGDDFVDGGAGSDHIDAGDGDDTVIYDAADSSAEGGNGIDTLDASEAAADTTGNGVNIDLSDGNDVYSGFENIIGSAYNDTLAGDDNNNVLDGGAGDDNLSGKGGADTFVLSAGNDTIQDFQIPTPTTVTLDFEGLDGISGFYETQFNSYKSLAWSNTLAINPVYYYSPGYAAVLTSGSNIAANGYGSYLAISQPANKNFDFDSGNFAATWNSDVPVTITAWDNNNEKVGTATMTLHPTKVYVDFIAQTVIGDGTENPSFTGHFDNINRIEISAGVDNNDQVAMDDLVVTLPVGDQIDIPDGFDLNALLASAQSDGNNGTLLTHDQGTLHLLGINPVDVTADLFV